MSATQCAATPQRGTATVALLVLAAPPAAWAGSWAVEPRLGVAAEYSSNPQLRDTAAEGHFGALDLSLPAAWDDGARQVALAPHARLVSAGGPSGSGRDAYGMSGTFTLQGERTRWSVTARWADESTSMVEPAVGTLTLVDVPRTSRDVDLGWTRALGARTQASLSLTGSDVRYSGGERFGLHDYRNFSGSGVLSYSLSERHSMQFVVGASRYEDLAPDVLAAHGTRSAYAQVGFVGRLDELWTYTLLYGASQTHADPGTNPSGAVYLAKLGRESPRLSLTLGTSRSLQASGFGTVTRSTEETAQVSWRNSELVTTSLAARVGRTKDAFGSFSLADRKYRSVRAGCAYRLSEVWSLDAALNWRRQEIGQLFFAPAIGQGTAITLSAIRRFGPTPLSEMTP